MTLEEINNLTYINVADILAMRLLGESVSVLVVADVDMPDYDKILMRDGFVKPTVEMFEAELVEYKAELNTLRLEQEAAQAEADATLLAEQEARRLKEQTIDVNTKRVMDVISYLKTSHAVVEILAGEYHPNPAAYVHKHFADLLKADMENTDSIDILIGNIEVHIESDKIRLEMERVEAMATEAAELTTRKCWDAIKYIIKFNQMQYALGNIDDIGLDSLETTFTDIFKALQGYRVKKAYAAIQAVDLTGTIYTETERTAILEILGA